MFNTPRSKTEDNVPVTNWIDRGPGYVYRPDRPQLLASVDRYLISSIYTRIAVDIAKIGFNHTRLDDNGRFKEELNTQLNRCLNVEANIDQTSRAFIQDIAMTMFDKGVVAIVPVVTTLSPLKDGGFDIKELRVGTVMEWFPRDVKVRLWNDSIGKHSELILPKKVVAIVENPFYAIMNENSSTVKRLSRKFSTLDVVDDQLASGKLNMLVHMPYATRTDVKQKTAQARIENIEFQLSHSKHGIAYVDANEKFTPLNRPLDNNLLDEIKHLTDQLYTQLGITPEILNGSASEAVMRNYTNRILEPVLTAIAEAMRRSFLSRTAIAQHQTIQFFQDPFALIPLSDLGDLADKLSRNAIMSPNEFRPILGLRPIDDPDADSLRNRNMPAEDDVGTEVISEEVKEGQNEI